MAHQSSRTQHRLAGADAARSAESSSRSHQRLARYPPGHGAFHREAKEWPTSGMGCIVNQRRTHARSARDGPAENDRLRRGPEARHGMPAANARRNHQTARVVGWPANEHARTERFRRILLKHSRRRPFTSRSAASSPEVFTLGRFGRPFLQTWGVSVTRLRAQARRRPVEGWRRARAREVALQRGASV